MTSLMSILFGRKNGKLNRKNGRRHHRRPLRMEWLENREMLAGGGISVELLPPVPVELSTTFFKVVNQKVPAQDILPGARDVVLAELKLSAVGRNFGRLTEALAIPAMGSASLNQSAYNYTLRADLNDNPNDGCEAIISYASADWQTDLLTFNVTKPVWVRNAPITIQVVAGNVSTWLSGDKLGVEVAEVSFRDLRNRVVPPENVKYLGVSPVLHNLEKEIVYVNQQYDPGMTAAYAGQKEVPLLTFYAWGNGASLTDVDFVASQGDLNNVSDFSLWANDWRGSPWVVQDNVVPKDGKVSFDLGEGFVSGAQYQVKGDIATTLVGADPMMKMSFPKNGEGLAGIEIESGIPLRGVAVNGSGAGQIQVWTSESTLYLLNPSVEGHFYVSEVGVRNSYSVWPGQKNVEFATFDVMYAGSVAFLTQVRVSAAEGVITDAENWKLWQDTNRDGYVDQAIADGVLVGDQVVFDGSCLSKAGWKANELEVHADIVKEPSGEGLRIKIDEVAADVISDAGPMAPLPSDLIHLFSARQPYRKFNKPSGGGGGGGGLG